MHQQLNRQAKTQLDKMTKQGKREISQLHELLTKAKTRSISKLLLHII
jgi:hypothetical protein